MTDNVTPIVSMHACASCKAPIDSLKYYEGHTEQCMQPEIRMRRLERMTLEHRMVIDNLAELLRLEVKNSESMSRTLETLATSNGEIVVALGRLASQVKI